METVAFRCDGWESGPVLIAGTFHERWKGLRPRAAGFGMLIRGGSVHGFGIKEPLQAVGLDSQQSVVGLRLLLPFRVIRVSRATQILELPMDRKPPPQGAVLTWVGGGSLDSLRNTHRQPE